MKSAMEHGEVVEKYLGEEREAQRVLGPFKRSLFPEVHVSPFGVIPKADPRKWRLILDLSSPHGNSVNDGIAKELCSLSYVSVDDIATRVLKLGRGAQVAKFDLKDTSRSTLMTEGFLEWSGKESCIWMQHYPLVCAQHQ